MKPVRQLLTSFSAATFLFASLAATIAVWSFISLKSWQEDSRSLNDEAGRDLVASNALQFSSSLMAGDRVSLQATLKELAHTPSILTAQIHDIENRLIAQAKKAGSPNIPPRVFSAPITVQDTIAGYLTLELSDEISPMARDHQVRWLTLTLLLCLLTAGIALSRSRSQNDTATEPGSDTYYEDESDDDLANESNNHSSTNRQSQVQLLIHCKNLSTLQQQLDHASYQLLLEKLELWLQQLSQLYHFQTGEMQGELITLNFTDDPSIQDWRFHALCCAQLIFTFSRTSNQRWLAGVSPQFSALLQETGGSLSQQRSTSQQALQVPVDTVMLNPQFSDNAEDDERLVCHMNEDGIAFVSALASRYTDLLAGQTQQLNSAIS